MTFILPRRMKGMLPAYDVKPEKFTHENTTRSNKIRSTIVPTLVAVCLFAMLTYERTPADIKDPSTQFVFFPSMNTIGYERQLDSIENAQSNMLSESGKSTTVFLLGIFSTLSETERDRRHRIRSTYLDTKDGRVCKLSEFLAQGEDSVYSENNIQKCTIPYAFIVGANPNGPTDMDDSIPMTVDLETITDVEDDVVYLNIKENMENGKSASYFKYASALSKVHKIDYIGKTDSDTMINMPLFYKVIDEDLPSKPYNIRTYGGSSWGNIETNVIYAAGQFYFLSDDMADYVSNVLTVEQRKRMTSRRPTEDMDMGNFVFSHFRAIKFINYSGFHFWFHPLKTEGQWMDAWEHKLKNGYLPIRGVTLPFAHLCNSWGFKKSIV